MRKQTSIVSMVILYYKRFFDVMRQMRISGSNPVSSSTGISDLQPIRVILALYQRYGRHRAVYERNSWDYGFLLRMFTLFSYCFRLTSSTKAHVLLR